MELARRVERANVVGGNSNPFDNGDGVQTATATVVSGPYAQQVLIGPDGNSVAELRRRNQARLDLDPQSIAVVDGHEVSEDTVIHAGQLVMFTHRAGEKGVGTRF